METYWNAAVPLAEDRAGFSDLVQAVKADAEEIIGKDAERCTAPRSVCTLTNPQAR